MTFAELNFSFDSASRQLKMSIIAKNSSLVSIRSKKSETSEKHMIYLFCRSVTLSLYAVVVVK